MKNNIFFMAVLIICASSLIFTGISKAENETADDLLISALYFETDIREAISDLMLQSGVNIIADNTVQGLVTLDLENVSLEKALKMILLGGGYSYRKLDDYYLVSMVNPRSPAFNNMAESRTIRLNYITAEVARALIPVYYDQFLRSSHETDMITITATPEIIDKFIYELSKIDKQPEQIQIQAVVTEISTDLVKKYGANLFNYLAGEIESDDSFIYENDSIEFSWFGKHERILANLKALQKEEKLEIKADPRILVNNRGRGSLFVGEEQVIILEPDEGSARLERVEVGVSLDAEPRIIGNEEIELTLTPSVSHFTEEADKRLRIRRSEMSTTIYTRNKESIVMAGMTIESRSNNSNKVPILGDIPIIRWFFRQDEKGDSERELFVFITTEIIKSAE
ncbi:MAG: secretin and TonB N-terminal domain-containing protein, partial [bacterium]